MKRMTNDECRVTSEECRVTSDECRVLNDDHPSPMDSSLVTRHLSLPPRSSLVTRHSTLSSLRSGSALLLALVTLVILSALMVTFLFRIRLETELATRYRFRMKSQALARAGLEFGKLMLTKSLNPGNEAEEEYGEEFFLRLKNLQRGMGMSAFTHEMEDGSFTLHIQPEQGRRNINRLSEPDWEVMLENSGVPSELLNPLIGAFLDWTDANDLTRLHGAESDDPFYLDRGYTVKNAPIDTIDELLLIKGFTRALLYGGSLEEFWDMPDVQVTGIARLLTVYGDGRLNLNTADRDVLLSLSGLRSEQVDELLRGRDGIDGIPGTEDDGFRSVEEALSYAQIPAENAGVFNTADRRWVRIVSIGTAGNARAAIWSVLEFTGRDMVTVFFREEEIP